MLLRRYDTTAILLLSVFSISGCSQEPPEQRFTLAWIEKNASKNITRADLGDVPGGLADPNSELVPLLGEGGSSFGATASKDTEITTNVSNKEICSVKAGTSLTAIAKNGKYLRALAEATCAGTVGLVEGFVPISDVKESPKESAKENVNTATQEETVLIAQQGSGVPADGSAEGSGNAGCSSFELCDGGEKKGRDITVFTARKYRDQHGGCVIPGGFFREPEGKNWSFIVKGDAAQWRVSYRGNKRTVEAKKYKAGDKEYRIKAGDVLSGTENVNGSNGKSVEIEIVGLDESGKEVGSTCKGRAVVVSPIVLDLGNIGQFEGTSLGKSGVAFDFGLGGGVTQTGWMKPTMGLLALDRNGNGTIDDGTELFGEATLLPNGKRAPNGYAALSQMDSDHNGVIGWSDVDFAKLRVWTDLNSNGKSEKGELRTLASLGIEKLGLVYSPSLRHGAPGMFENDVRYESRYWGPQDCGREGCLSFDVYFAALKMMSANK